MRWIGSVGLKGFRSIPCILMEVWWMHLYIYIYKNKYIWLNFSGRNFDPEKIQSRKDQAQKHMQIRDSVVARPY